MSSLSTRRRNLNDERVKDTTANEESSEDEENSVSGGSSRDENDNGNKRPTVTTQKRKLTTDEEIANKYSNAIEEEQSKKTRRVVVTPLSSTQLLTGLTKIFHSDFPTLSQKGQEPAYVARIMQAYKAICHDMAPNVSFLDTISKIESLGGKKEVKLYLQHMRDEQRNQVLDKIIGQVARERILQDTTRITNNIANDDHPSNHHEVSQEESNDNETDNAAMDASSNNALPKVNSPPLDNYDDDDEEKEADFDDLEASPDIMDAQSNNDEEKEADLDDSKESSKNDLTTGLVVKATTSNSQFDSDEEMEADFKEEETTPNIQVHSHLEKDEEADLENIDTPPASKESLKNVELDEAFSAKVDSHSHNDNETGEDEKEADFKEAETAPDIQVHSDWNTDEAADLESIDTTSASTGNSKNVELEVAFSAKVDSHSHNDVEAGEDEKEADFKEAETAPDIQVHSHLEKGDEEADLESIDTTSASKGNLKNVELDEAFSAKIDSHSHNDNETGEDEKEADFKEAEAAPDIQVHSDWNTDEAADLENIDTTSASTGNLKNVELDEAFSAKVDSHSHNDDKMEATIENVAAKSQIDLMEECEKEGTENYTGGIVEEADDSEALVFDVSQEQIYLAQTQQTKQSESDFFLFSSEEFPTQLLDSSSQFVPEFLSTPKDPPTQLAESDSTNEDSETPTQLADSQFFMTQN